MEDGILILTEDEDRGREEGFVNRFRVEEEELVYLDGQSSNFLYIDADDGDRFRETPLEEVQVPVLAVMTEKELIRRITADEHFSELLAGEHTWEQRWAVYCFGKNCEELEELLKREDAAQIVLSAILERNCEILAHETDSAELEKIRCERDGLRYILDYLLLPEKQPRDDAQGPEAPQELQ